MQSSKVGKYNVWYKNSDEFYELKKEIFGENSYYLELEIDDPVIVDAGANIGMTVLYYKMLFPNARIIAFEPIGSNFELLKKNIEENQLDNVEIYQAVVAPKSGILRIHEPVGEGAWKSGAGIIPKGWKGIQKTEEIKVDAIGIQEILRDKIDIFKMDIEGMEYEVIRNMGSSIRQVKQFIIEAHPRKDHRIDEIKRTLVQNGYVLETHDDPNSLGKGLVKIYGVLK